MGLKHSKSSNKNKKNIYDYSIVNIPPDTKLIKIISYNLNLKNSINVDQKIKEVISYLDTTYKNKSIDIICLQGFLDKISLDLFIREYKNYCIENKLISYFAPTFDNIESKFDTIDDVIINESNSYNIGLKSISLSNKISDINYSNKKVNTNIIISKYPILSTIYSELDDKTDMDDILGIQSVIGANILIGRRIITVYNLSLCKDIKLSNIINNDVRKTEIETLDEIIKRNNKDLQDKKFKKYIKSDINLITGLFNISEIEYKSINQELLSLVQEKHFIDLYRQLNIKNPGYTTINNERLSYFFMILTSDFYNEKSNYYTQLQQVKNSDDLMKIVFKRYNIHFFDIYVIKSINKNFPIYYPIECIFLIKNK